MITLYTHDIECMYLMLFMGKSLDRHDMRNKCVSMIFLCSYSCNSRHSRHVINTFAYNFLNNGPILINFISFESS